MKWEKEYKQDIWRIEAGEIKISIIRDHVLNRGYWTMHCHALRMDTVNLKLPSDQPVELAKDMAISMVRNKLKELSSALGKVE